jgi:hypothetical protein
VIQSPDRRLWTALLLAAALAGCGSPSDAPTAQETPEVQIDACQLFTPEDAKAVAGTTVSWLSSTLDDAQGRDPLQCAYNAGTAENPRILSLLVRRFRSPEAAARTQKSSRSALQNLSRGQLRDVPGLGEGAQWVAGRVQQLHVLKGDVQLVITVQGPGDQLPGAREVAATALARLENLTKSAGSPPNA